MNDAERRRKLSRVELVTSQANRHLTATLNAMRDAMAGQPGAQSYEQSRTTGHTTVLDENGNTIPAVSDPTGEAAITDDLARADEARLDTAITNLARTAEVVADIYLRWKPPSPADAAGLRTAFAKLLSEGEPGCEICARVDKWVAPHVDASDCKGNLPRPYRLCVWCWRWVLDTGRLPTRHELEQHHAGRKPKRPAA